MILEELYVPKTIENIPKNAFEKCTKLNYIQGNSKFLDCLPKEQITNLSILNRTKNLENVDFFNFKNLLEFEEEVENVPLNNFRNCPKLTKLICSPNLLKNLQPKDKEKFQNIELEISNKNIKIPNDLFKNCTNLENINGIR